MDDVIHNIKIEDIVPRNHRQTNNSFKELEDLATSIRENGIKEPLIVKRKDDRYEIISGNKRYRAAILAGGISTLPVIIKDYSDDNLIKNVEKNDDISFNSINNNSDIVNLSELNKEYEREDFNMNNELTNNNVSQPVTNGPAPTFGGRFFPSLEDQPTNMTFNAPIEQTPVQSTSASNLIDLTDTSNTPVNLVVQPTMSTGIMNPTVEQPVPGNILNLESLTQNKDVVQSVPVQPEVVVPVEQQPVTEVVQPAVTIDPQPVIMETPVVEPTLDLGIQPDVVPTVEVPVAQVQTKDVLPVINTLKAVSVSLESFGYTVRITDEDLPTSYKITIEVEK